MNQLYENVAREHGTGVSTYLVENLRAFIDDNICLWNEALGSIDIVNREFDRIKREEGVEFIMVEPERSNNALGQIIQTQLFLDLTIKLTQDEMNKDIYDKSAHNFVPWASCHPHNTRKNIPYSLALRIRTICDDTTDQSWSYAQLEKHLGRLGYPKVLISDAIMINEGAGKESKRIAI